LTEKQQNICVVGDDAQSIYGLPRSRHRQYFVVRAALSECESDYARTELSFDADDSRHRRRDYQQQSGTQREKTLDEQHGRRKDFYYQAYDADNEARFVASKIEDHQRKNPADKYAILYRTNAQSRVFEEALRRQRIEYNIVGGFSFYERAEVKDVIAYLKLALNPFDDIALLRVINTPTRGLGKTSLDELTFRARDFSTSLWETLAIITDEKYEQPRNLTPRALEALRGFKKIIEKLSKQASEAAQTDRSVSEVVIAAIEDTGYSKMLREENSEESETWLENLQELVNAAVDYDKQEANGLRDFIDHSALSSDTDKYDRNAQRDDDDGARGERFGIPGCVSRRT
jgi:DNA helicase-2/ATP-dependent DNA helicase PcrA